MLTQEQRLKNGTIEKALRYLIKRYVDCARLRKIDWAITDELAIVLMRGNCHYCGCEPAMHCRGFKFNGIDRKDSKAGYVATNVLPCCTPCNRAKGRTEYNRFLAWLDKLAEHRWGTPEIPRANTYTLRRHNDDCHAVIKASRLMRKEHTSELLRRTRQA